MDRPRHECEPIRVLKFCNTLRICIRDSIFCAGSVKIILERLYVSEFFVIAETHLGIFFLRDRIFRKHVS
jgi:hypothetical protein